MLLLRPGFSLTSVAVRGGGGQVSAAALMLAAETQGLGLDFTDSFFRDLSGLYGSARVKDTSTPANTYNSHPFGLCSYPGASVKLVRGPSGTLRYGAHNLYLNSEAPANQSITLVAGMAFQIVVTGTVSITLSGAATGTVTAGNPISFTSATTTLTCGSTSGSGTVHLRRTPSDDTYLKTTSAAAYELPYEWDANGDLLGIRHEPQRTNSVANSELNHADWRNDNVSVAAHSTEGVLNFYTITEDTANAIHRLTGQVGNRPAITAGQPVAYSIFLKVGTRRYVQVAVVGGSDGVACLVDTETWTIVDTGAHVTSSFISAALEQISSSVYRVKLVGSLGAATSCIPLVCGSSSAAIVAFLGETYTGTSATIVAAHGQLELNSTSVTSPIETAGSTVTRAADVIGPDLTAFPWNSGVGTYEVDGVSETPTDNGTILTLAPRSGETHIQTVKWVPSP